MKTKSLLIASACLFLSSQTTTVAAPYTSFGVGLSNNDFENSVYYNEENYDNNTVMSYGYSRDFTGSNSLGQSTTMSLSIDGKAQAGDGALKTYLSLTVSNLLFPEYNNPYVTEEMELGEDEYADEHWVYIVDPNGVPSGIEAGIVAGFTDVLSLTAATELSMIQVALNITGSITNSNLITQSYLNNPDLYFFSSPWSQRGENYVDTTIWSNPINVSNTSAILDISFDSNIWLPMEDSFWRSFVGEGQTYTTTVDFFNTLSIADIIGFDQNGQEVFITNVTGESGTTYISRDAPPVAQVPEPGSLVLIASGFLGLALMRRNRHRVAIKKDLGLI